jgi:peptide/nickel transport system ATP-binding protein
VEFTTEVGIARAVDGISFEIRPGEVLGVVGESGCGKSVTAMSLLRLIPSPPGRIASGSVLFQGRDLLKLPLTELRKVRGRQVSMIFQDPMQSLSPLHRIGAQLVETVLLHRAVSPQEAWTLSRDWLAKVGMPDPDQRMQSYPFELSGGMRQRVVIAMALMLEPDLVIADEPTTALDVTIQAQVFDLMRAMRGRQDLAAADHARHGRDLGDVRPRDGDVCLAHRGDRHRPPGLSESAPPLHAGPAAFHAAGQAAGRAAGLHRRVRSAAHRLSGGLPLRRSLPARDRRLPESQAGLAGGGRGPVRRLHLCGGGRIMSSTNASAPLLSIEHLSTWYPIRRGIFARTVGHVKAVNDVSLTIGEGETLGLVGESGCGKTTLGRTVIGLEQAHAGSVRFRGQELVGSGGMVPSVRRHIQMVFQDPAAALNPRMTVSQILTEGMAITGCWRVRSRRGRPGPAADVGLDASALHRYPFEFSGGQRQRICVARALSLRPSLIICDEAVSALDVSVQAQVINLLLDLKDKYRLSYLFISHDLSVVKFISDRIAVMYLGHVVEQGPAERVLDAPLHPYTRALVSAVPVAGQPRVARQVLTGELPSPARPPAGCPFHPRCPVALPVCREAWPAEGGTPPHRVHCHLHPPALK